VWSHYMFQCLVACTPLVRENSSKQAEVRGHVHVNQFWLAIVRLRIPVRGYMYHSSLVK